jgi:hypothetical protein
MEKETCEPRAQKNQTAFHLPGHSRSLMMAASVAEGKASH